MEDEVKVELGRKPMDRLDDLLEEAYAMKAAPAILTNLTAVQKKIKKYTQSILVPQQTLQVRIGSR
jgi:hypothetical protein